MIYSVDNPPPGHVLKEWTGKNWQCSNCAADTNDEMCGSTKCSSDKDYVIVKLTLRHLVAEAVK